MIGETLKWWIAVEVLGVIGLPLAVVIFRRLPDAGYAFAKPVSLLIGGYVFWLALTAHVLSNRPGSIVWVYLLLAAISGLIAWRQKEEMARLVSDRWQVFLAVEVIFTLALFAAAHLRSYVPDISATEKPMDFMFLNAASRSRYYPPDDAWLSGFHVSYYYFGYVIQAMLGKLAGVQTSVAFNLGIASTVALSATAAFGLGYNLIALAGRASRNLALAGGVAAVALFAVIGNLEGVLEFARANGLGSGSFYHSLGIGGLDAAPQSTTWYPTDQTSFWWWFRATRIIPDAGSITEFPFFSFLLGDLHPHVMAIPFVLVGIAVGVSLWRSDEFLSFDYWRRRPGHLVLIALLVGGLGFLNTWDLPTFGFLVALLAFARNLASTHDLKRSLVAVAGFLIPLAALAVVAYVPFYLSFSSQATGLRALSSVGTRPLHALLIWGPLFVLTLPLAAVTLGRTRPWRAAQSAVALSIPAVLLILWAAVLVAGGGSLNDAISNRGANWTTTLLLGGCVSVAALALWRAIETDLDEPALVPALAFTTVGLLLILGADLFFIKDLFNSRINTVFKLYYQAWLLLAAGGAFSLFWLATSWQARRGSIGEVWKGSWVALTGLTLAGALLYPLGATLSRTNGLASQSRTLDGIAYLSRDAPDEFLALDWVRKNTGPDDVIAEGQGDDFSNAAIIAAASGVPTVLGWQGHEIQWGRDGRLIGERRAMIDNAYKSESLVDAVAILQQYGVTYVLVGQTETAKYPAAGLQKFASLPARFRVFTSGQTSIYRVPRNVSGLADSP